MHVIDTPKFIVDLADIDVQPAGAWELNIFYDNPEVGPMIGKAKFDLMAFEESITSSLEFIWTAEDRSSPTLLADLDGQMSKMSVQFQLHIMDAEWTLAPFVCTGTSLAEDNKYEGRWHVACTNPEECGGDCPGVDGDFSLTKVKNKG